MIPSGGISRCPCCCTTSPRQDSTPWLARGSRILIVKTTTVAQGCSVVVSHVRSTIERSAERVVMLYDGMFQWEGSVDAFRTTDNPYVVQFRTGSLRGPMQPAEH